MNRIHPIDQQAHRDVTPLQLLLLRAKRRLSPERPTATAAEALRRYLLDDPSLFAAPAALGDDGGKDDEEEEGPEAAEAEASVGGGTGAGSSDGGSSGGSESGEDERGALPDSPVKAKAAGASPVNGAAVSVVSQ